MPLAVTVSLAEMVRLALVLGAVLPVHVDVSLHAPPPEPLETVAKAESASDPIARTPATALTKHFNRVRMFRICPPPRDVIIVLFCSLRLSKQR